jgi:hypothetical protein
MPSTRGEQGGCCGNVLRGEVDNLPQGGQGPEREVNFSPKPVDEVEGVVDYLAGGWEEGPEGKSTTRRVRGTGSRGKSTTTRGRQVGSEGKSTTP